MVSASPSACHSTVPRFESVPVPSIVPPPKSRNPFGATVPGPLIVNVCVPVSRVCVPEAPPSVNPAIVTSVLRLTVKVPARSITAVSWLPGTVSESQFSGLFQSEFPPPPSQETDKRRRASSRSNPGFRAVRAF